MENVPQAATSKAWREARAMLVKSGYGLTEAKVDASFYGVPQRRRRLFVVGRLGEVDGFLTSALAAARSDQPTTVRDMLGNGLGDAFYCHPRMPGKRAVWSSNEPAPTMRSSSRRPMPPDYRAHPDDATLLDAGAFYTRPYYAGRGVRTLDEPAPAVIRTSRERPRPHYLANPHPNDPVPALEAAVLTQEQVARIQGFPVDWDWSAANSRDTDQLIANAVPAPLAEAIGRVILARHAGETVPEIPGQFGQWLRRKRGFSKALVRNAKTRIHRARRLLGGRTFADHAVEIAALEAMEAFASLSVGTRSEMRSALRLLAEWRAEPPKSKQRKTGTANPETMAA